MKQSMVRLGRTGIVSGRNAFGALPIQRDSEEVAVGLLLRAYDAGFTFFDTARAYTDSERKLGLALRARPDMRERIVIATKTMATTAEQFWADLSTSLSMLGTDRVDIYQFHNPAFFPRPGDGSGLYEAMLQAKAEGKIRFIGLTNHRLHVAEEAVCSGLYDTLQFPFCYLASEKELALVELCREQDVGFIAMKALSGGLLTNAAAAYAYLDQFENVLPIWGIQRAEELEQFIGFMEDAPMLDDAMLALIEQDRAELCGEFCRACGYCMPCPKGITISQCARMIQLIRRSPSAQHLSPESQAMMEDIRGCVSCGACMKKCPYGLPIPALLRKNYEDYQRILRGEITP